MVRQNNNTDHNVYQIPNDVHNISMGNWWSKRC